MCLAGSVTSFSGEMWCVVVWPDALPLVFTGWLQHAELGLMVLMSVRRLTWQLPS